MVRVTLMYFGRAETVERRRSRRRKGALVAMLRSMDLCVSWTSDTTTKVKIAGKPFHKCIVPTLIRVLIL